MTTPEDRLAQLGHALPPFSKPLASYVPAVRTGNLVFVSGQVPLENGAALATGSVPAEVDEAMAKRCAERCTLNGLAVVKGEIGELSKVRRVVRVGCFVASDAGYGGQPGIANAASDLLVAVFGKEKGSHARAAVGCSALPLNVPVEIEFVFEVG